MVTTRGGAKHETGDEDGGTLKRKKRAKDTPRKRPRLNGEGENDEDEKEDPSDGLYVDRAQASKSAKITPEETDEFLREYLPHLKRHPQGYKVRGINKHDPTHFLQIDAGSEVEERLREEIKEELDYLTKELTEGVQCRKDQATTTAIGVFSDSKRKRNSSCEPSTRAAEIIDRMHTVTIAKLGRGKVTEDDLRSLPGFTVAMLKGWIVYILIIKKKDGSLKVYIGVSLDARGGGFRVFCYEIARRLAIDGYFREGLVSRTVAKDMLSQDVEEVLIRPLMYGAIPTDESAFKNLQKVFGDAEGHWVDNTNSMADGYGFVWSFGLGWVDFPAMVKRSREVAPKNKYPFSAGLNAVHPHRQGYQFEGIEDTEKLQKAIDQGGCCPIDDTDITQRCTINPLRNKVPGLDEELICLGCANWLRHEPTLKAVLKCNSKDEVRAVREASKNIRHDYSDPPCTDCPLCERHIDHFAQNPFQGLVSWFNHSVICLDCHNKLNNRKGRTNEWIHLGNLRALYNWVLSTVPTTGGKKLDWEADCEGEDCPMCEEPFQLRQVVDGKLQKAAEAGPHSPQQPATFGLTALQGVRAICKVCYARLGELRAAKVPKGVAKRWPRVQAASTLEELKKVVSDLRVEASQREAKRKSGGVKNRKKKFT